MFRGTDRRRRRRRDRDDETAPTTALDKAPRFDAELCETVDAGGEDSLLRVAGRWSPAAPSDVVLVRFGAGTIERFEPLPPGPASGRDGLWRAAFQVAQGDATGAHFALMTPDNAAVALPRPTRRGAPRPTPAKPPEPDADERLRQAEEDLADANALVDQLRRRCALAERGLAEFRDKLVTAWGESASMRDLLDEREAAHSAAKERARSADAVVAEIEARAERSREELAARRDELQDHIARLQGELLQRVASERTAAEQLAETEQLRADAADALARFESARAETDALKEQLDEARAQADAAAAATARAAREILDERMRADNAVQQADAYGERVATAERELREAREELAQVQTAGADTEELVEALSAEKARADEATRRVEQAERELAAMREELAEAHKRLAGSTGEGEEPTPAHSAIEEDLRHLLERRERELEDARAELAEQRERYAAVASEVPPVEEPPTPPRTEPWSRVDEDLLERLARAKSLAGQD